MKIKILPDNIEIEARPSENLLSVIARSGVLIDAGCAGTGVCGQCRVRVEKGEVVSTLGVKQSAEEYAEGWRQACLSKIKTNLEIFIPLTSRIEKEFVSQKSSAPKGQFLSEKEISALNRGWAKEPLVQKFYLELPAPSRQDNRSDMQRILQSLRRQFKSTNVEVDLERLKYVTRALRLNDFKVTVSLGKISGEDETATSWRLVHIEPGNTVSRHFSLAFDIGTTSISGQLLDLNKFQARATVNNFNQQKKFGADVITRIVHADQPGGIDDLQMAAVKTINEIIDQLLDKTGVRREEILYVTAAGNTTMTHLLLGLTPQWIRLAPYTPVANVFPPARAKELGIDLGDWVYVHSAPCPASYVGGDIVAGVLATGIYQRPGITLYIDIGTNGEIVLGNKEWMFCASCSAGPAFEGGGIRYGINAGEGAVERFYIDAGGLKALHQTIGNKPARGICGSGIINITAELLKAGLIDRNGKINLVSKSPLVRAGKNGPEVLIVPAPETALNEDIVFSEPDLDNLIRAKAAMFAGYRTLLANAGLGFEQLDQILIAGNFGSYLDIENAVFIGLLPDIDRNQINFIGNGSLLGARLINFSQPMAGEAIRVSRLMTNIELADNSIFSDEYVAGIFLPHTDEKLFPSVMAKLITRSTK